MSEGFAPLLGGTSLEVPGWRLSAVAVGPQLTSIRDDRVARVKADAGLSTLTCSRARCPSVIRPGKQAPPEAVTIATAEANESALLNRVKPQASDRA